MAPFFLTPDDLFEKVDLFAIVKARMIELEWD
jgi:hypothetical protein